MYEAIEGAPGGVLAERDPAAAATRADARGRCPPAGRSRRTAGRRRVRRRHRTPRCAGRGPSPARVRGTGDERGRSGLGGGRDRCSRHGRSRARCRVGAPPWIPSPPLELPEPVPGGVRLATGWVEPAYLEPDASWCAPGGEPATPLANGGAFGGKAGSPAPAAARELADATGRPVRVVYSREDVVRLGPKRPPIAAVARWDDGAVVVRGSVAGDVAPYLAPVAWPYDLEERGDWATSPGDRSAHVERAACGRPGRTRGVARRRAATRPESTARRSSPTLARATVFARPRVSRRRAARSRARASSATRPGAIDRGRTCASPPVIRSTRSCSVPTRSAPRTWRWGGC